ncbi:5574_t:CDS:1 [Racocetra persica]|uniref:5574_t:CDS:1 n=1 Tax=Racocetra persica TaxID=160502 RepID=A0ACA9LPW2_9GLOM|nr:5574_t:CDS:1 [Racocetra persica]
MVRENKFVKRATITDKKCHSWNAREKLAAVLFQEKKCSIHLTAAKFNVKPKQICDWREKKEMLMKARPHIKRLGDGAKAKYPELEKSLVSWIKELRQRGKQVTRCMVQLKAKGLAKQLA